MPEKWRFYGRGVELSDISKILSSRRWYFCALSGRRRIGKTTLIQKALEKHPELQHFYFQVPDSDERGVVQTFQEALEDYGLSEDRSRRFRTFRDMAKMIGALCDEGFAVIIDEFQYFHRKSLLPFTSYLQHEVDRLRDTEKGGLFVLGSIHTEMTAILDDRSSPLFNRLTHRISIDHWDFETLFEMFDVHGVIDEMQRLFLWTLFEGVPKFYRDCYEQEILVSTDDYRRKTLRHLFFEGPSPLRDEASNWFLRELRGRYDSVLKILANKGPCTYRELVAEYGRAGSAGDSELSGYLHTLIDRYRMVEKLQPVFAKKTGRKARYVITDNFLAAWLRAIARNVQMSRVQPVRVTIKRADQLLEIQEGYTFEKMVRLLTEECSRKELGDFPVSGLVCGYWNKSDHSDVELDLVAYDQDRTVVRFGSCKRSAKRHDTGALHDFERCIERFMRTKEGHRFRGWDIERVLYSPKFFPSQRQKLGGRGYLCLDLSDFRRILTRGAVP